MLMLACGGRQPMTEISADDVRRHFKEATTKQLEERLHQYKTQREEAAAAIKANPTLPAQEQITNSGQILVEVLKLRETWNEVMPYIRHIRSIVGDLLAQNKLVASYLLFGKFSQGLQAIFMLLEKGFHYEALEIVRSNREALDLIPLFLREPDDSALLKQWFAGDIVENAKAREAADRYLKEAAEKAGMTVPIEGLKSGIYRGLSKFSHVSYLALLD